MLSTSNQLQIDSICLMAWGLSVYGIQPMVNPNTLLIEPGYLNIAVEGFPV